MDNGRVLSTLHRQQTLTIVTFSEESWHEARRLFDIRFQDPKEVSAIEVLTRVTEKSENPSILQTVNFLNKSFYLIKYSGEAFHRLNSRNLSERSNITVLKGAFAFRRTLKVCAWFCRPGGILSLPRLLSPLQACPCYIPRRLFNSSLT